MILGLFPELGGPGGVQEAGRQVARALAGWALDRGLPVRLLGLNDPPGTHSLESSVPFMGFGCSKTRFAAAALTAGWRGPALVCALHPNLAPLAWRPGAATIVFAHGIEVWAPLGAVRRRALQAARLVCAPSADTARRLVGLQGVNEARVQVLPWAAPGGSPGPLPPAFPGGRRVLAVSRLDASEGYKGIDKLIEALPDVARAIDDVAFAICGDGDDRPHLEALARARGVEGRVLFLGTLSREELDACYGACDVFALPSAGEGFGLVYLEAMAAGKPCVGGRHGGAPEVIEDEVTGLLVRHGDLAELARALVRLLSEDRLRHEMGERGRARVAERYTFDCFSERLRAVLDEALA